MKLVTIIEFDGIPRQLTTESKFDRAKSVKITGKHKQRAQAKRENVENTFMQIAAIERKKAKKANFFNKCKTNK